MSSYDQCKCLSDTDQKPNSAPKINKEKKKCICGRKVCKDVCSSKPCYKGGSSLEGIIAKQMMELISCGCNQLLCQDTCTKKPCSEKTQIKGVECKLVDEYGAGSSKGENVIEDITKELSVKNDEEAITSVPVTSNGNIIEPVRESCQDKNGTNEGIRYPCLDKTEAARESSQAETCIAKPIRESSQVKTGTTEPDIVTSQAKTDTIELVRESCQAKTDNINAHPKVICMCANDIESEPVLLENSTLPIYLGPDSKLIESTFNKPPSNIESKTIEDTPVMQSSNKSADVPILENIIPYDSADPDSKIQQEFINEPTKVVEGSVTDSKVQEYIKDNKETVEDPQVESVKENIEDPLIGEGYDKNIQDSQNVKDCQCILVPKPRRTSKIPRPISQRTTSEGRTNASMETEPQKCFSILKKDTEEAQQVNKGIRPILEKEIFDQSEGVKEVRKLGKAKPKKESCGCNKIECKDTCKYKQCKNTPCGCNREVCKDSCKNKPCFKPVETVMEDLESVAVEEEEVLKVTDNGENVLKREPENVEKEITTEGLCDCSNKICEATYSKNPSNPPDIKDTAYGLDQTTFKDSPSTKPYNTSEKERPIFNGFPNYVKNLIGEISCLCKKSEAVPKLIKDDSKVGPTISTLKLGVESLREKCKNKDIIIDSLRCELQNHTESNVFSDLLNRVAHPIGKKRDFDRYMVAQELSISESFKMPQLCDCNKSKMNGFDKTNPTPLQIVDVKRLAGRYVLVKWIASNSQQVVGYEIYIGGKVVTRVVNRETTATVFMWEEDGSNDVNISIYAFTEEGRCFPPATAEYKGVVES